MAGTEIGSNYVIEPNVMIGSDAIISDSCKIQNNVCLYKETDIKDDVFCGRGYVFTNVNYQPKITTRLKRSSTNQ